MQLHWRAVPYLIRAAARKFYICLIWAFYHRRSGVLLAQLLMRPPEEQNKILAICASCPQKLGQITSPLAQCNICLCLLHLKTKFKDEVCPLRPQPKW